MERGPAQHAGQRLKCLYHLERPEGTIVAAVHVDDLLFSENNKAMWKEFKDASLSPAQSLSLHARMYSSSSFFSSPTRPLKTSGKSSVVLTYASGT